ncbi:MAG: nucleotide exchange factor GrpE [Deltaproteobacteria bacterium]|nr:nucleotide exchange factor GrpE [Deltaproteobacteria bacterium]MBW2393651.1 nucleotide exchange factor GrpE [Deltaproteobacteria bacterium]
MSQAGDDKERSEGWEALTEEPAEGTLAPSSELEDALREAAEAVEARAEERHKPKGGGPAFAVPREAHERVLEQLEAVREELEAQKEASLRLQADFENLRRRALKERQDAHAYGHEGLARELLATVDNLERAIEHAKASDRGDFESILQGVELVQRELLTALAQHAVNPVEAEGLVFDPNIHEAMAQAESEEAEAGTVLQVLQPGYQLRDRLLRPARVVVSRKPEAGLAEKPQDESEE